MFLIISECYCKQLKFSDVKIILEDITEDDLRIDPVHEIKLHRLVVNLNAECQANKSYLWIMFIHYNNNICTCTRIVSNA